MVRGERAEMVRAVTRAMDIGINYFDTARIYGDGKSESNLGSVLKELRADVLVGTKVRLTVADMENIETAVVASVEGSLTRLGREYVDLIQLHNPLALERQPGRDFVAIRDLEPIANAFRALQEQGKARFWGINGLGQTEALHQAVSPGNAYTIQACYNLLNQSAGTQAPPEFPFQDYERLIDRATARQKRDIGAPSRRRPVRLTHSVRGGLRRRRV
jgi:aryl-alcohol dehydrogenase-like predicted oxidoreductase